VCSRFNLGLLAAGLQYMALSTITLLAHDPRITSLGPLRIPKLEDANVSHDSSRTDWGLANNSQAQIMYQVRLLCGIAVSNETLFTTKLASGTAIAMCMLNPTVFNPYSA
jgi:hypothetical protein